MHGISGITTLLLLQLSLLAYFPGIESVTTSTCNLCATDGSSAVWSWDTESDPDFVIIVSNLCPDTTIENAIGDNTNSACTQGNHTFWLPKVPVLRDNIAADNDRCMYAEGAQGISISNAAIYGPATGPTGGDAGDDEIDTFDWCGAHADPDGIHHYHTAPYCINIAAKATPVGTVLNPSELHSPLWGWAPDGFPLYGPYGDDGETPGDLDDCQGHYGDSGAGGGYHYHYNAGPMGTYPQDSNEDGGYPYFQACIRGCVPNNHTLAGFLAVEDYDSCVASSSAAPAGSAWQRPAVRPPAEVHPPSWAGQDAQVFWDSFAPLNYSCVALGNCSTVAPTYSSTAGETPITTEASSDDDILDGTDSLNNLSFLRLLLTASGALLSIYFY